MGFYWKNMKEYLGGVLPSICGECSQKLCIIFTTQAFSLPLYRQKDAAGRKMKSYSIWVFIESNFLKEYLGVPYQPVGTLILIGCKDTVYLKKYTLSMVDALLVIIYI